MEHLPDFISNHFLLISAFVGVSLMLLWSFVGESIQGLEQILPLQAVQLINHEDAIIIDVRESHEYEKGHVIDSIHIPLGSLENTVKRLEKYREKPIVFGCQSGHRSMGACRTLKKHGFERLYNLKGGVNAWQHANLPLTTEKSSIKV